MEIPNTSCATLAPLLWKLGRALARHRTHRAEGATATDSEAVNEVAAMQATERPPSPAVSFPMDDDSSEWTTDALLKLHRAVPRQPGDALDTFVRFSSLMLRISSLTPQHQADSLGEAQRATITAAILAMQSAVRTALQDPLTRLTPSIINLLRSLARGSDARAKEYAFVPADKFLPGDFRTHRFGHYENVKDFVNGLARAELAYEVNLEGFRRLRKLNVDWFFASISLGEASVNSVKWATALLFDGLRLRRGLEVAAPVGLLAGGQRAPFGLDSTAVVLLSDGETNMDRERVGRAAQFLLAASRAGVDESEYANWQDGCCMGRAEPNHPCYECMKLAQTIGENLRVCRDNLEQRSLVPGKSMRIILDAIASCAEEYSWGSVTMLKLAFAYPCLVPLNLRELQGYDGGLLSVWDACNHLLKLHAQEHKEVLPMHSLVCAVLGGVVGNLMSGTITGPFVLHEDTAVMKEVRRLNELWPSGRKVVADPGGIVALSFKPPDGVRHGKMVSATAVVCDAIERRNFKTEHKLNQVADARFDGALTMLSVRVGLGTGPGVHDSRPTDGIVAIKRLYFAALHAEPGIPMGREVAGPDGGPRGTWTTSPYCDGVFAWPPGTIPTDCIEMPWREIMGGALVSTGPLFAFSRSGFEDSLVLDWKPHPDVASVLRARETDSAHRSKAVMLPAEAMRMMTSRAQRHVANVASTVENCVQTVDGPPVATRVVAALNNWANVVYANAVFNPIWESSIAHFCSPPSVNKRQRVSPPAERAPVYDRAASPLARPRLDSPRV